MLTTLHQTTPAVDHSLPLSKQSEVYATMPPLFCSEYNMEDYLAFLSSPSHWSDKSEESPNSMRYLTSNDALRPENPSLDEQPSLSFLSENPENQLVWDDAIDDSPSNLYEPRPSTTGFSPDMATTFSDLSTLFSELDDGYMSLDNSPTGSPKPYPLLSAAEESRLRSIAMPALPHPQNSRSSSPESKHSHKRLKRRSSESSESGCLATASERFPPNKKAHNMIEKRYRAKINDKITALRDCIPSLRDVYKKPSRDDELQVNCQGASSTQKLNKATVLSKATEYILYLEKRASNLNRENKVLKARIEDFEILLMAQLNS